MKKLISIRFYGGYWVDLTNDFVIGYGARRLINYINKKRCKIENENVLLISVLDKLWYKKGVN